MAFPSFSVYMAFIAKAMGSFSLEISKGPCGNASSEGQPDIARMDQIAR
jgi:hypothetical protein